MIYEVVKIYEWDFINLCCIFVDEFLVIMDNEDYIEIRIVCYCGEIEK